MIFGKSYLSKKKKCSYRKPLLSNYQVNSTNRVQNLCWKIEGSDSYFVPGSTLMINLTKYMVSISLMCISIVQHQLRSKYSMSLHSYQKNNTLPRVWLPSNSNKSFPITSQPIGKGTNMWFQIILSTFVFLPPWRILTEGLEDGTGGSHCSSATAAQDLWHCL